MQATDQDITEQIFKHKQKSSQTSYLCFRLKDAYYAINIQNIIDIIENPSLVYLSHMSPPIIGMQHYLNGFIPALDFAGYRPYSQKGKLLILSTSFFRKDHPFCLVVDQISRLVYFKHDELIQNPTPFNELLPAFYYAYHQGKKVNFLDLQDLANQID